MDGDSSVPDSSGWHPIADGDPQMFDDIRSPLADLAEIAAK